TKRERGGWGPRRLCRRGGGPPPWAKRKRGGWGPRRLCRRGGGPPPWAKRKRGGWGPRRLWQRGGGPPPWDRRADRPVPRGLDHRVAAVRRVGRGAARRRAAPAPDPGQRRGVDRARPRRQRAARRWRAGGGDRVAADRRGARARRERAGHRADRRQPRRADAGALAVAPPDRGRGRGPGDVRHRDRDP